MIGIVTGILSPSLSPTIISPGNWLPVIEDVLRVFPSSEQQLNAVTAPSTGNAGWQYVVLFVFITTTLQLVVCTSIVNVILFTLTLPSVMGKD